ncbi:MAG: 4'-phosphopantetheinyl transferase superfamily protein [Proteobacteria bacterium]|nr:4'-phosphopantetheinyl transferase superfamily protein [Pseudomonadota bacterium]
MIGFENLASVAPILASPWNSGRRVFAHPAEIPLTDWSIPVPGPEISADVRIWYVPHGPRHASKDQPTLTREDRAEFAPIRDAAVRNRSLTTRAALRIALSEAVEGTIEPHAWRFGRTEMGKPVLENGPETLSFSCSHTEAASIIAISKNGEIGIDIEASAFPATEQWLADTFTPSERKAINALPISERSQAVSRLWTLKEAYLKMLGTGIADALVVAFDPRNNRLVSGQKDRRVATTFQTWIANCQGQPLSVAVAIRGAKTKGASWRQSIEECLVRLRAKSGTPGKRADQGTAIAAPLFRGPGAAPAGSPCN